VHINDCNWCDRVIEKQDERWHVSELGTLAVFHSLCWDERLAQQPVDEWRRPQQRHA
jgi:hypothetical protein